MGIFLSEWILSCNLTFVCYFVNYFEFACLRMLSIRSNKRDSNDRNVPAREIVFVIPCESSFVMLVYAPKVSLHAVNEVKT